jgi:hypothetical protein
MARSFVPRKRERWINLSGLGIGILSGAHGICESSGVRVIWESFRFEGCLCFVFALLYQKLTRITIKCRFIPTSYRLTEYYIPGRIPPCLTILIPNSIFGRKGLSTLARLPNKCRLPLATSAAPGAFSKSLV